MLHCFLLRIQNWARRLGADRRGNVAIIFALSIIPVVALIGMSVDYSRASQAQATLQATADEAALAAVSVADNPNLTAPNSNQAQQLFQASASTLPQVTLGNVSVTSSTSTVSNQRQLNVTVSFTATIATTITNIIGISSMPLSGTASASRAYPTYANFYLLLDNSPSMGLGATQTDINNLQNLTGGLNSSSYYRTCYNDTQSACAFACHKHTFSSGYITGDDLTDCYHLAKNNNITTRIDVLRMATQSLTQTAQQVETVTNQIGMAVYTFSDTFQTIDNLDFNLTNVASKANAIDLAYAYYDKRDFQTAYDTAFSYMSNILPQQAGDGSSSSSPQSYLFIVTDGVSDQPVSPSGATGDPPDQPTSYQPPNTQPNLSSSVGTNVTRGSKSGVISGLNTATVNTQYAPSICTTLKNRGIKIIILYTTYLPLPNNAFYNQHVSPIINYIPQQLQDCASPGLFQAVSPTQGIQQAMNSLFQTALAMSHLTN